MDTEHRNRAELARRIAIRLSMPLEIVENMLSHGGRLQEMCDNYETCRTAAEEWRSIESTGQARIEEFAYICDELEAEIVRTLTARQENSPDPQLNREESSSGGAA